MFGAKPLSRAVVEEVSHAPGRRPHPGICPGTSPGERSADQSRHSSRDGRRTPDSSRQSLPAYAALPPWASPSTSRGGVLRGFRVTAGLALPCSEGPLDQPPQCLCACRHVAFPPPHIVQLAKLLLGNSERECLRSAHVQKPNLVLRVAQVLMYISYPQFRRKNRSLHDLSSLRSRITSNTFLVIDGTEAARGRSPQSNQGSPNREGPESRSLRGSRQQHR